MTWFARSRPTSPNPEALRQLAMCNLWQAKYFEALVELRKANKGAARLRRRLDRREKSLLDARALMRDLWRLDGDPSDELAQRCKAFMGGG